MGKRKRTETRFGSFMKYNAFHDDFHHDIYMGGSIGLFLLFMVYGRYDSDLLLG